MQKTDDFIFRRIVWKATQYKLPTNDVVFFKDIAIEMQNYLTKQLEFSKSGIPTLFFTNVNTKSWTLVCTRQILFNTDNQINSIDISNIARIRPTFLANFTKNPIMAFKEKHTAKGDWYQLTIFDKANNEYIMEANKGGELFALWNILLMLRCFFDE